MSEIKILLCGCSFDGYEFKPCPEHPVSDEEEDDTVELTPAQQADLRERFTAFRERGRQEAK